MIARDPADIYCFGREAAIGDDRCHHFKSSTEALLSATSSKSEIVLVAETNALFSANPAPENLDRCDVLHCGLLAGAADTFGLVSNSALNWLFLDAKATRTAVSWRATPHLCWLRPDAVRSVGGIDSAYETAAGALMDIAYRILVAGGRTLHDPDVVHGPSPATPMRPTLVDEMIFLQRHLGRKPSLYATFWEIRHPARWSRLRQATRQAARLTNAIPPPERSPRPSFRLLTPRKQTSLGSVTAIIPTLDRYAFLPDAIKSLLELEPPVEEVIVADQTSPQERAPDLYAQFPTDRVRVIYLDHAGQSSARNAAIGAARGDWLLFFDDDSVAWPDMLREHIRAIEFSGAIGSTGIALPPNAQTSVPGRYDVPRVASVFATGNALISRETVQEIGGFDRAYDHGSGADEDFGTRLHLNGFEIIFTPSAISTHHKANTGGLRSSGSWWGERLTYRVPCPSPTQIYAIRRFYPRRSWLPLMVRFLVKGNYKGAIHHRWLVRSIAPWVFLQSYLKARRLERSVRSSGGEARSR